MPGTLSGFTNDAIVTCFKSVSGNASLKSILGVAGIGPAAI